MTQTTDVGRLILSHPDRGHPGGVDLHSHVRTAWTKIADNMADRFFTQDALADSSSVDFQHNFKCAFSELKYSLYLRDTGTGELTRINEQSTPAIGSFAIAATPGQTTTHLRVTNNSGSARDIAMVITQVADEPWRTKVKTGAYDALDKDEILADTSGGSFAITLPATPALGARVRVADFGSTFGTNTLTIGRNGNKIHGFAADLTLSVDGDSVELVFNGTDDWRML